MNHLGRLLMPYKCDKNKVFVKRNGTWVLLKEHETAEEARRHANALNAEHKK